VGIQLCIDALTGAMFSREALMDAIHGSSHPASALIRILFAAVWRADLQQRSISQVVHAGRRRPTIGCPDIRRRSARGRSRFAESRQVTRKSWKSSIIQKKLARRRVKRQKKSAIRPEAVLLSRRTLPTGGINSNSRSRTQRRISRLSGPTSPLSTLDVPFMSSSDECAAATSRKRLELGFFAE